jgi:hypothetical protein
LLIFLGIKTHPGFASLAIPLFAYGGKRVKPPLNLTQKGRLEKKIFFKKSSPLERVG